MKINYVKNANYGQVLRSLEDDVKIPSVIAKDADIFQNHIYNNF